MIEQIGAETDVAEVVPPYVAVERLALSGPRGPVFGPVSFGFDRGDLVVVTGRSGSGRTALLMALAGRLHHLEGRGRFGDLDLIDQARRVRDRVALARIGGFVDLEPQLSVEESITERALADAVAVTTARRTVDRVCGDLGLELAPTSLVSELSRLDQGRLALALACVRPAELIVFDDVDHDLTTEEQLILFSAMVTVAERGPAVLTATVSDAAIPAGAVIIEPRSN